MTLAIPLSSSSGPLFRQVYLGLRAAMLSGALASGAKLPSTRELAEQLAVSRTVALLAYDQLLAEGFAVSRRGSGTYVADGLSIRAAASKDAARVELSRFGTVAAASWRAMNSLADREPLPYDFAYGRSDLESFPLEKWRRTLMRCIRTAPASKLDYGDAGGNIALRTAVHEHLRRSRAVDCDPSQVIIVNGSQQALDLIARVLIDRGDRVALENPTYLGTREMLRAAGARLLPVAVDEEGIDPDMLPANARLCFVTPSHQFPTGAILPLARRLELLDWARRANAVIVEDDYDGEFRYEGQPLESLQGLDRDGRVIYLGTFSRTIFPSIRIGYLVAPKPLVQAFTAAKWLCDRHTATLEQQALAEFMRDGTYSRYLRRVRRRNEARREALIKSIRRYLGDRVKVAGEGAGSHIVLWLQHPRSERDVIARAAARGVGIYGISPYYQKPSAKAGFILGYSRMRDREIREGIRRLAEVLF